MGSVRLYGATSGYLELQAPDVSPYAALVLPSTGFGKVLQVVRATDGTNRTTSSSTSVDVTGMSVTITPQKSTSTLIIMAFGSAYCTSASTNNLAANFRITDSSNNPISGCEANDFGVQNLTRSGTGYVYQHVTCVAYATPATTSAVTYKLQFKVYSTSATISIQNGSNTGQMYAIEVAA